MSKFVSTMVLMLFVGGVVFLAAKPAYAGVGTDFGAGPGCSAIEGVDATTLEDGDFFVGRISCNGVTGVNPRGKELPDPDGDGYHDSLEGCINDALLGFCSTITGDESGAYTVLASEPTGQGNQCEFTLEFSDTSTCAISECSDHVDNEPATCDDGLCVNGGGTDGMGACTEDADCDPGDGFIDFPDDPECSDYDDNNESE